MHAQSAGAECTPPGDVQALRKDSQAPKPYTRLTFQLQTQLKLCNGQLSAIYMVPQSIP